MEAVDRCKRSDGKIIDYRRMPTVARRKLERLTSCLELYELE